MLPVNKHAPGYISSLQQLRRLLLLAVLLTACAPTLAPALSPGPETAVPTRPPASPAPPTPTIAPLEPDVTRPVTTLPPALEIVPTQEITPVVGEAPADLLDQILADLAARLEVGQGAIQIVQAEAVVWNDGSLGCPKPGEFYTQALVPGYHVVLRVDARDYDYRASERGYFFLCERNLP